jgi:hypothetical protein
MGMKMSDKKPKFSYSTPPTPPSKIRGSEARALRKAGRKDAKYSASIKDFTRTQAVTRLIAESRRGEISLALWYQNKVGHVIAGNNRITVEASLLCTKIKEARQKLSSAKSNRETKRAEDRLDQLQREMNDLEGQFEFNAASMKATRIQAEILLPEWQRYYEEKASIYQRARLAKLKMQLDATSAELPVFPALELPVIPELEVDPVWPYKDPC